MCDRIIARDRTALWGSPPTPSGIACTPPTPPPLLLSNSDRFHVARAQSWHLREAGLKRVHALMEDRVSTGDTSILPSDPGAVISACGQAVTAGLRDRVPQVFFAATAAVGTWLSLVESEGTGMHDIRKAVDAATAAAVDRLGESNARFRKEASAALATVRGAGRQRARVGQCGGRWVGAAPSAFCVHPFPHLDSSPLTPPPWRSYRSATRAPRVQMWLWQRWWPL